jgi:hypothetical protein
MVMVTAFQSLLQSLSQLRQKIRGLFNNLSEQDR